MSAMALAMSSPGAVSGLDSHVFAGAATTAQARYHNRPLRLSSHSAVQETLLSRCLAGNVSTSRSGKGFGSGRRKRSGNGSKRRVFCRCAGSGEMGKDDSDSEQRNNEEINDEVVGTSGSANQSREKKSQATTQKMGNPLREMIITAGQRLQDYLESYKQSKKEVHVEEPEVLNALTEEDVAWEKLQKLFSEVAERQNLVQKLQFQMEEAVNLEDFEEAGRIKKKLAAVIKQDPVAGVMDDFKKALDEERYSDAAYLRDEAGAGLVGWWAGVSEGDDDPYGRIINISPAEGRFIAKGYSARQLALAAAGVPLFEVYLTKDDDSKYQQHPVYLQRDPNGAAESIVGFSKDVLDFENMLGEASKDMQLGKDTIDFENMLGEARDMQLKLELLEDIRNEDHEEDVDLDAMEEGLKKILDFLKDRMPDVKMKVFQVIANGKIEADLPKIVEQLMEDAEDELLRHEELAGAGNSSSNFKFIQSVDDFPPVGSFPMPSDGNVGSVEVEILGDDFPSRAPHRVPAKIERRNKDNFVFHIEESQMLTSTDASGVLVTDIEDLAVDAMPLDVEEFLQSVGKTLETDSEETDSEEVELSSKDLGELLEKAVSRAQQRRGLFKSTLFQRINIPDAVNDPFSGLYIGSMGPHSAEVVQLQRKYGNWQTNDTFSINQELQCFEYVEAVKLTGDVNVPAGQVSFRARVGKGSRLPHRGVYPEELGVTARYKGQARMAEPGFKNPQWVDGELVLLNGKGGPTSGAELGFVYLGPGSHFLVLFGRLRLRN
ncbi:hypothetical protein KC19_5G072100 [Ceratodon purpureus]|uniref:UVR domain-containing protein n=1 Tax=Ceratodon purpureus TaxID=3225 RepID=A0A8T0HYS3_CERPU|nr:hypothetical protein KC19_5G072100 [Ceratodon purpureus]